MRGVQLTCLCIFLNCLVISVPAGVNAQTLQELERQRQLLDRKQSHSQNVKKIRGLERQIDALDKRIDAARKAAGITEPSNNRTRALERKLNKIDRMENKVQSVRQFRALEKRENRLEKQVRAERTKLGATAAPPRPASPPAVKANAPQIPNNPAANLNRVGGPGGGGAPAFGARR